MRARRAWVGISAVVLGGAAGVLFLASPLALARIGAQLPQADITRMGDLGAAYGGISALLAGIATAGVAAALMVQIRQFRTTQAHGVRLLQMELMKMLIQDPGLQPVSPSFPDVSAETRRRAIFANLMFRYLELGLEIGYFPREAVEAELREQLQVEEVRRLWSKVRGKYAAGAVTDGQRRFIDLIESAYRETTPVVSVSAGPPAEARTTATAPGCRSTIPAVAFTLAAAIGAGAILAWARRSHCHRESTTSPAFTAERKSTQAG